MNRFKTISEYEIIALAYHQLGREYAEWEEIARNQPEFRLTHIEKMKKLTEQRAELRARKNELWNAKMQELDKLDKEQRRKAA